LAQAVQISGDLVPPGEDHYYDLLWHRYNTARRFLPTMLRVIEFQAKRSAQSVLDAWQYLGQVEGSRRSTLQEAPLEVMTKNWREVVVRPEGKIDRRYYTFCVLEQLREALYRREIFVTPSERWGDPHAKLLQGPAWEASRSRVCHSLDRSPDPELELAELDRQLDEAYHRTAQRLPENTAITILHDPRGRDRFSLQPLDKLEEPPELLALEKQIQALMPRVDLPDVLLEVQAWTGFASEFTHLTESDARVDDQELSVCAVLLSEACNLGLRPLTQRGHPAFTRARLSWVEQHYLRVETLTAANARLVDAQAQLPLAQVWGGGEVASADGLRFRVPVRTLNAGPNSKYFGVGRGVTYYNFTSDQFTGFHSIVIPGTLRDSLYILEGLLEHQTSLEPKELMSDTAGYSDLVFGLFWLLGYQFSPRIRDVGHARFWRINREADYGALDNLARHPININLIRNNWDDLLRIAGSLKMGMVRASELLRSLQPDGRTTTLGRALRELGRIRKTLFLLAFIDDEAYRRRILVQLNRGEARHTLARIIFHGQRGEVRQRYREGQEDQLGALGLVLNAIALWNTRYMGLALEHLKAMGEDFDVSLVQRISPLQHEHINMLGRYHFALDETLQQGALRPLRDPDAPDEQF